MENTGEKALTGFDSCPGVTHVVIHLPLSTVLHKFIVKNASKVHCALYGIAWPLCVQNG